MFESFVLRHRLPSYRLSQLYQGVYQDYIDSFDMLSTWPAKLREQLQAEIPFPFLHSVSSLNSLKRDTEKVLFERQNKKTVESVLMRHTDGRNTVCVSCMTGCPVGCTFCATGTMGFGGNLEAHEIVAQVLYFAGVLKKEGKSVSNIVFMGMGEPMLNLKEVEKAISICTDPKKMGMSIRRITISTSGIIPQLSEFIQSGFTGRLAISLHAPNQKIRELLMPVAKNNPYQELLRLIDEFIMRTHRRVSIEYILIKNVNDRKEHAKELARLFARKLVHINCIPYNAVSGVTYERPTWESMRVFTGVLKQFSIPHTLRVTMGDDIQAACGQLSDKKMI